MIKSRISGNFGTKFQNGQFFIIRLKSVRLDQKTSRALVIVSAVKSQLSEKLLLFFLINIQPSRTRQCNFQKIRAKKCRS